MKDYTKAVKDILDENGWCFLRHGGKGKVWMADWLWQSTELIHVLAAQLRF